MPSLPIPSALSTSDRALDALDAALAALQWVMTQRPDRPTSIESVRRAATTVLTLATKLLAPPPRHTTASSPTARALDRPFATVPPSQAIPMRPDPSGRARAQATPAPEPAPSPSVPLSKSRISKLESPSSPLERAHLSTLPLSRSSTLPLSPAPILAAYDTLPPAQALREKAGATPPRAAGPPSIFAHPST